MNSSTLTGLAAVLFGCGLVALFAALYRDAAHGGPLLWLGLALLAATVVCWFMAPEASAQRTSPTIAAIEVSSRPSAVFRAR